MAATAATTDIELGSEEIFERIDVLPPYYALTDVKRAADGTVTAMAPIQQPFGTEVGPITGAEAGRHLAIAGSVAAAWINPDPGRFHYLAYDAELRRARAKIPRKLDQIRIGAKATVVAPGTTHAIIQAESPDAKPIFSLSCYYMVAGYDDLRALFADNCMDAPAPDENPYARLIEPADVDIAGGHIELRLGPVQAADCAGHFSGLPAMPVAYLMSNVMAAAGRLLQREADDPGLRYTVREASVRADALAFAGEDVVVTGERQGLRYGTEWVYCEAFANGDKRVGAVHLKLKTRSSS